MDCFSPLARDGFATIDADAALKDKALANLSTWLTDPDFAAYRPQTRMADPDREVGRAARLLLPDHAVRHRRPPRGGRHRPEPHEPVDARRQRPGALRVPQAALPRACNPLHVVLAFDVRQFEDKRKRLQPRPAEPGAAPVEPRVLPVRRRRLRRQRHPRRTSCRPTASGTSRRRNCRSPSATCRRTAG